MQPGKSSIVRVLDRYRPIANRTPTKAVDVDRNPGRATRRHGYLLVGIAVALAALVAVAVLQVRATNSRNASSATISLALDVSDAIAGSEAPVATEPLHGKLIAALGELGDSTQLSALRDQLAALAPAAIAGEPTARSEYGTALRSTIRAISRESRVVTIRTQQYQMGIVAGAAIGLIALIGSVAAKRHPDPRHRRSRGHHPSQVDPLTGLGRIDAVRDRLSGLLATGSPSGGFVAMLAVGIQPEHEHFLPLSRAQLDAALLATSRRLRAAVRATDTVARLARDELAVALPPSPRVEDPGRVASKILGALDKSIDVGDAVVVPNPRVGVAIAPLDAVTADGLIQRARLARRAASDSPAAVYRSYSEDLAPTELGTIEMQEHLRAALEADDGQLWVAYQPKIDLTTERVVGFEALARWNHPSRGTVPPSEFIRVAEETDLILDLGLWVLNQVCAQIAAWATHIDQHMPVSVNVSGRQFEDPSLATTIREVLQRHQVPANLLELELTEGVLLEDRQDLVTMMHELRELGVKIAVDDFGTGYSALSYLKRFPIDVLKIDRAFIRDLNGDDGDEAISTAIIAMAHSLALEVVAEGVETPEQLHVLQALGCDTAQGFYFAHPAPPAEIEHRAVVG